MVRKPFCNWQEHPRQSGPWKPSGASWAHFLNEMMFAKPAIFSLGLRCQRPESRRRTGAFGQGFPRASFSSLPTNAIDLGHWAKHGRMGLPRQAGGNDAHIGTFALQARRIAFCHAAWRHCPCEPAQLLHDETVSGARRASPSARSSLGFEAFEAATEGEDVDAHGSSGGRSRTAPDRNPPSYSKSAVPRSISQWVVALRHSIESLPPGSVISTRGWCA